ncbi:N-acetylneuraminate synthase family protein [Gammaproteobacteria bacterium]|nr:N-acetylneuraminate synthase family protein [Gammaproteobacteria bacterium]
MEVRFEISEREVGEGCVPLVIAEMGINHGGDLTTAINMVDMAIDAGAEIVKHQTHIVEDEMSKEAKAEIPDHTDKSVYEIIEECALDEEEEYTLMQHVESRGCIFLSTPFSRAAANRLQDFGVQGYKIGSGECNNYPLVEHIAKFGKPIIMSTGMNSIESIKPSVEMFRKYNTPFALLHCTNVYPTPPELVRLGAMQAIKEEFPDAVIGLSDHTTSNYTCLGAVALGASILERHFTDTMEREGPDISCSMDPQALTDLIEGSNTIFSARGGKKGHVDAEKSISSFAFASVVAIEEISVGDVFSKENIWVRRPSGGDFTAADYDSLIGRKAKNGIKKGDRICKTDLS